MSRDPFDRELSHDLRVSADALAPARAGWERLIRGQAVGHSMILEYNADDPARQKGVVSLLQIGGGRESSADDACPIVLTLAPPRVVRGALDTLPVNGQDLRPSVDNFGMLASGDFPGEGDPIVWPQLEAIVEWGTGGINTQARVDFLNGLTINLSASWLRVSAAAVPTSRSGVIGTSAAYWLGAFASLGWTEPGRAQKTMYVGELDNNEESEVFPVPRFAKRAYLVAADPGATPALTVGTLRFWRSPDGQPGGNGAGNFFVSGNQPQAFDIPNAGLYFTVKSGTSASDVPFLVVFDLSI